MSTNVNEISSPHAQGAMNNLHVSDDDDESFVVLGKSLDDLDYEELDKAFPSSVNTNAVTGFQKCIQEELNTLEGTASSRSQSMSENSKENSISCTSMANLPEVPSLEKSAELENGVRSMVSSFSSVASATPENLQNKIEQLIKEKEQLQKTIVSNNANMKEHYDTISQWKEKVQAVHEANKEKILEAKEISQKLKTENTILKKRFTEQLDVINSLEMQIKLLKEEFSQKVHEFEEIQLKQAESEKNCKTKIAIQLTELEAHNIEKIRLNDELTAAKQEIAYLKTKISIPSSQNSNLETKIEELERIVAKLYVEKEFVEKENQDLKDRLKDVQDKLEEKLNLEQQLIEKDERIKELEQVCTKAVNENDNLRKEIISVKENITSNTELELQIGSFINKNEELEKQIEKLKDDRAKVEANAIQNEIQMKAHIEKLQNDLQSAFTSNVRNQEEFEQVRQQLMNAQAKITQFEETIAEGKNLLLQKERELATKSDNYFALETQLDLYKNDFEAERSAREHLNSVKDQLTNDIQQLQRRNQQLQEEIEVLRERGFVYIGTSNDGVSRSRPSAPSAPGNGGGNSPPLSKYSCPVCLLKFRSLRLLEDHVESCIHLNNN